MHRLKKISLKIIVRSVQRDRVSWLKTKSKIEIALHSENCNRLVHLFFSNKTFKDGLWF